MANTEIVFELVQTIIALGGTIVIPLIIYKKNKSKEEKKDEEKPTKKAE